MNKKSCKNSKLCINRENTDNLNNMRENLPKKARTFQYQKSLLTIDQCWKGMKKTTTFPTKTSKWNRKKKLLKYDEFAIILNKQMLVPFLSLYSNLNV